MADRSMFLKYAHLVKEYVLEPESAALLQDFKEYYAAHPTADSVEAGSYFAWTRTSRHATQSPAVKRAYEEHVGRILGLGAPSETIVQRFVELDFASRIGGIVDSVIEGKGKHSLTHIGPLLSEFSSAASAGASELVTDDLSELLASTIKSGGVEWRLEELNRSVGPLRQGDFVLLGKRPEAGGTSFVCSEITHMVPQLPPGKNAVFFNNEEAGRKVGLRLYQTALGVTSYQLGTDPKASQAAYQRTLGGRKIDVIHRPGMDISFVESILRGGDYGIIVFNTLAKIDGFGKLEGAERMAAVGGWARKIADQYGVVFAVHQADNTAEGVEWLDQSQLYGSKTGLQGESDVQLMLGKSNNPSKGDIRYLSVVRNKMPGGPRTDPALKYMRAEVGFDWQTGRFNSLSYP